MLVLNAIEYLLSACEDAWVVDTLTFQVGDNLGCFIYASVGEEPSGGFWQPRDSAPQDEDEDELECQRKSPSDGTADEREAIVDPIDEEETKDVLDKGSARL